MKSIIEIIIGIILVVIGFIGGLIPVLPGWIVGLPGLLILSKHFPPLKKIINKLKNKIKK